MSILLFIVAEPGALRPVLHHNKRRREMLAIGGAALIRKAFRTSVHARV
jgi:hypothetical protein